MGHGVIAERGDGLFHPDQARERADLLADQEEGDPQVCLAELFDREPRVHARAVVEGQRDHPLPAPPAEERTPGRGQPSGGVDLGGKRRGSLPGRVGAGLPRRQRQSGS